MNQSKSLLPFCTPVRNLGRVLRRWLARDAAVRLSSSRLPDAALEPAETAEDRPKGCGWFDSSHELGQGLVVREHDAATAAQALAEAPLADWLAFQLAGWRPPAASQA